MRHRLVKKVAFCKTEQKHIKTVKGAVNVRETPD